MTLLDVKLLRDLRRMKGQTLAVALVMACGLAMLIMTRSLIYSLERTRQDYYRTHRFADVFVTLKRAPRALLDRIRSLPGVATVQPGVALQVTVDLPHLDEPASGLVRSLPDHAPLELNRLHLHRGRFLEPGRHHELLVSQAFAEANGLRPGDPITLLLNGRRQVFRIAGLVLSPEIIFEARPGVSLPDNRTYGTFWMWESELAAASDMEGAFNTLALTLAPGASAPAVCAALDRFLQPYGGRGAFTRTDHPSHVRVSDEIFILRIISIGFPTFFLGVAAFMTHAVLMRLLTLQREQLAVLKAFGFSDGRIALHYLKFGAVIAVLATTLGTPLGILLGHRMVRLYHMFFRFPELQFHLDLAAVGVAVSVGTLAAGAGVAVAIRRVLRLAPAEAMRPEPPAQYRPALPERLGIGRWLTPATRMALRNLERHPAQAFFTVAGLVLATALLIVPNCFRDSVNLLLGFQWDTVQRQDLNVGLVDPRGATALHALRRLPGVLAMEPIRSVPARIRFGPRSRQLAVTGTPAGALHSRIIDRNWRQLPLLPGGVITSAKLAEVLGARPGDLLEIEFLEGRRTVCLVPLLAVSEDLTGMAAHMEISTLNRLLGEGDVVNGASFTVDPAARREFLRALKDIPQVGWVSIKNSLRENFRQTTATSINVIQRMYLAFAVVVAFGVVYNNARITLAERARELATLRVLGFTETEVATVLLIELAVLTLLAVPGGLLLGGLLATALVEAINTETVRLPAVLTLHNFSFAAAVVALAALGSAVVVLQRVRKLDLIASLRAPE
ncbi:FtsX-like permease family protein [Limisphaera ngatamarikiensis]|uniref:FtsX-like permease family protein n=1 Tax=Limisphaera ngatamarikiensis TaxID=1324935 RepID=A0A6M1RMQ4_9BACT|nr:FtsX-like permease family protein [Limisphaera ngatamarikiensis]NGO38717.1 FtsX-like permease family protein [Limisphaera ngatamarikiensis]